MSFRALLSPFLSSAKNAGIGIGICPKHVIMRTGRNERFLKHDSRVKDLQRLHCVYIGDVNVSGVMTR